MMAGIECTHASVRRFLCIILAALLLMMVTGCQNIQLAASPLPVTLDDTPNAKRNPASAIIIRPGSRPSASSQPRIITYGGDLSAPAEPKNKPIKAKPSTIERGYAFLLEDWF